MKIPEKERAKILAIAREVRGHVPRVGTYCLPEGLCGEASLALSVRLTRAGIPHQIIGGRWTGPMTKGVEDIRPEYVEALRSHAWIQFPQYDGAILDVTPDQYHVVPGIWFPANEEWYESIERFNPDDIFNAAREQRNLGKPRIPLTGPRFRRPPGLKVRVRNHLRHPPKSCLCHRSKTVDRVRRSMVRRLR